MSAAYLGNYTSGQGNASNHLFSYDEQFNCRMVGTFNVMLKGDWDEIPCIETHNRWYWFVSLANEHLEVRYAWVTRDKGSKQPKRVIELLTKAAIPDSFKTGSLSVTPWHPWTPEMAKSWAKGQYWFQSWPWTPTQKADSQFVWDGIKGLTDWSGKRVLDIGGNAGFHSFRAAEAGAQCVVVEPSYETRLQGANIARHIEHQDVTFVSEDPGGEWDTILYLSVHHQLDPTYERLEETLAGLRERAGVVIVELHVEPLDGDMPVSPCMSEREIDGLFSQKILSYPSNVRGRRALYVL